MDTLFWGALGLIQLLLMGLGVYVSYNPEFIDRYKCVVFLLFVVLGSSGIAVGVYQQRYAESENIRRHEADKNEIADAKVGLTKAKQEISALQRDVNKLELSIHELVRQGRITKKNAAAILSGIETGDPVGKVDTVVQNGAVTQAK